MTDKVQCEFYLAVNEDGGFIVCKDEEDALTKLGEDEGGYHARVVKITAKLTPPQATEAEIDISDEAGETKAVETEAA